MRGQRLAAAMFLAAAGIAGVWVLTSGPDAAQTVRVDAPVPTVGVPAPLTMEELIRQALENVTSRPPCEAPPVEVAEEFRREAEKALATAPIPSTVPSDPPLDVINVHRRVVPC